MLHLLIETGDGNERRHISLGAYLLYTLNFTTFISGPIQRYDEFARDQFAADPMSLGPRVIGLQLERIVRGFFKVNVLAMLFDMVQVDCASAVDSATAGLVQIFCSLSAGPYLSGLPLLQLLGLHRHCDCLGASHARALAGKLRPAILAASW